LQQLCLGTDKFLALLHTILSTLDINEILTTVVEEIRLLLKAERCTLYIVDKDNKELYSRVLQAENLVEIRVMLNKSSLAGYSAITGKAANISDAYNYNALQAIDPELRFDKRWDEKSGYKTKSILVVPVPAKTKNVIGVFQALNKEGGFTGDDEKMMDQLAYLLGIAVSNAILYQSIEEERLLREYIMDDIDEGICILDTKKKILSANKFLELMSGMRYDINNMTHSDFFDIFPNFLGTELEKKINEVLTDGFKKIAVVNMINAKIIPYLNENGVVNKLILIFTRSSE
jgi:hypothetical protein